MFFPRDTKEQKMEEKKKVNHQGLSSPSQEKMKCISIGYAFPPYSSKHKKKETKKTTRKEKEKGEKSQKIAGNHIVQNTVSQSNTTRRNETHRIENRREKEKET